MAIKWGSRPWTQDRAEGRWACSLLQPLSWVHSDMSCPLVLAVQRGRTRCQWACCPQNMGVQEMGRPAKSGHKEPDTGQNCPPGAGLRDWGGTAPASPGPGHLRGIGLATQKTADSHFSPLHTDPQIIKEGNRLSSASLELSGLRLKKNKRQARVPGPPGVCGASQL